MGAYQAIMGGGARCRFLPLPEAAPQRRHAVRPRPRAGPTTAIKMVAWSLVQPVSAIALLMHARGSSMRARHAMLRAASTPTHDDYHVPVLCAEAVEWLIVEWS